MAQEPIQGEFRWTRDEFLTANKQHRRHSRAARQVLGILWVVTGFLLFAGIVRTINREFDTISAICLIGGILLLVSRFLHRRVLERMFEKLPDRDADVRWEIHPDRLVIETATSKTESAWSRIGRFERTDRGFLLYPHPGAFYWLPFHSFAEQADIQHLHQLLTSQTSNQG